MYPCGLQSSVYFALHLHDISFNLMSRIIYQFREIMNIEVLLEPHCLYAQEGIKYYVPSKIKIYNCHVLGI